MQRFICLILLAVLSACNNSDSVQLNQPDLLSELTNRAPENIYAVVEVNGTGKQRFSGNDWSVDVNGIIKGADNTIEVTWYERYLDYDLLLARQAQTFFVSLSATHLTIDTPYTSSGGEFDCDSDGVSNLAERLALTDPCAGEFQFEPDMVAIPAGCFDMGSPPTELESELDEQPQKNVCVSAFEMSRYEATFREYDPFTTATARTPADDFEFGRDSQPALVSWLDATAYAAWLSQITGKTYRLPTEAEWEYAARANTAGPFYTGERINPDQANFYGLLTYNQSSIDLFPFNRPMTVGLYDQNPFGLFDMHGNVWEWACSRYDTQYNGQEQQCIDSAIGTRVSRGGSWFNPPKFLRSAKRSDSTPDFVGPAQGFRLVREIN